MKRLFLISASVVVASSSFAQSRCITAPINMTGSQVTLTSSGAKTVTKEQVYIYYSRRHPRRHQEENALAGVNDRYPSVPLLLSWDKSVKAMPEAYNVSLAMPQSNVSVCPDSTLDLNANINLEKVSSFTGNYPNTESDKKVYEKVTRREYKMACRKMRKIKKNEEKIARRSGMTVDVKADKV